MPLKNPLKPRQLSLEVFDPAFFIDFQLAKRDPVRLIGAPPSCQLALQRSDDGSSVAQKLNEESLSSGGNNANFGAMFANKITVDCP